MKNNKLKESLFESGILEEGSEKILAFKRIHRANYLKDYNKDYKQKTKRKALVFTNEEFDYLSEEAKRYDMKLSSFLKKIIFAYLSQSFVPLEKERLSALESLLRAVNNRIGNTLQFIELSGEFSQQNLEELKGAIRQVEYFVSESINNPPDLHKWLISHTNRDPLFLQNLLRTIAESINT